MGFVRPLPSAGWGYGILYRCLPDNVWGEKNGYIRHRTIEAWRESRKFCARLRKAKELNRIRREFELAKTADRTGKPKERLTRKALHADLVPQLQLSHYVRVVFR
ncbi:MAG: hypothetical protein CMP47_16040 [Rickettsiales bacterium]|nr:hypothetical protein [Rickettsiales bacterium]